MVIDASALANAILMPDVRRRLAEVSRDEPLAAPDLIDAEITSAAIGLARGGVVDAEASRQFVKVATMSPIRRIPCGALAEEAWSHRERLSAYDAFYVSLAARLEATLITDDQRLARGCRGIVPTVSLLI